MNDNEMTTILVCLNSNGRAIQAVGPFLSDKHAIDFFDSVASPAYHGYTLVSLVHPDQYAVRA